MDSSKKKKDGSGQIGYNDGRMKRDIQLQVGNEIPLSTESKLVLIRPYLKKMMMTIFPFDSDSRSGSVVGPCVVDVFVELETSNSNQDYDSVAVAVAVVGWRIAHLRPMLTKMCLYPH